ATFHVLAIPMVTSIVGQNSICLSTPTNYTATHSGGTGVWSIVNGTGAAVVATNGDGSATVSATAAGTVTLTYAISGFCGNASQSLSVNVIGAPGITTQPSDQTVTYGNPVSFSVASGDDPAPTYQWQVNTGSGSNDIPGETSSTLTIATPTVAMSGYQYQAIVSNSCFSTTSNAVNLTVDPLSVTVTADANQTKIYGSSDPTFTYT